MFVALVRKEILNLMKEILNLMKVKCDVTLMLMALLRKETR